mmetsp:Transcript_30352/g.47541  ORF Transcript_30352/g.47541 Transcript_30352/m.47541 type:complete len:89 (+) Transcript_30352:21-287(+)
MYNLIHYSREEVRDDVDIVHFSIIRYSNNSNLVVYTHTHHTHVSLSLLPKLFPLSNSLPIPPPYNRSLSSLHLSLSLIKQGASAPYTS